MTEPWNDPIPEVDTSKYPFPWEATHIGRLREPPVDEDFKSIAHDFARPLEYSWTAARVEGKVLDVGAGVSYFAGYLHQKRGHEVVAADIGDYSHHHETLGVPFVVLDGKTLPFADNEFDTVCLISVLEHVEQDRELAAECMRVARDRIILSAPYSHRKELEDRRTVQGIAPLQKYFTLAGLMDRFPHWRLLDFNFCTAPQPTYNHEKACFTNPEQAEVLLVVLGKPETDMACVGKGSKRGGKKGK